MSFFGRGFIIELLKEKWADIGGKLEENVALGFLECPQARRGVNQTSATPWVLTDCAKVGDIARQGRETIESSTVPGGVD